MLDRPCLNSCKYLLVGEAKSMPWRYWGILGSWLRIQIVSVFTILPAIGNLASAIHYPREVQKCKIKRGAWRERLPRMRREPPPLSSARIITSFSSAKRRSLLASFQPTSLRSEKSTVLIPPFPAHLIWPEKVRPVPTTARPVTHTAEVAMNRASHASATDERKLPHRWWQ